MGDEANLQLECFLYLVKYNWEERKFTQDLKRDIVDSVSTLRNVFANLNNSVEEQMAKIGLLESKVNTLPTGWSFN